MMNGEATIAERKVSNATTICYNSWFCPFGQRAWIALEEKGVDYKWVEISPYKSDPDDPTVTKVSLSLDEKRDRYPEFVAASPKGLVPAICNEGEKIHESLVVAEYIDESYETKSEYVFESIFNFIFPNTFGNRLMPVEPLKRAQVRIWMAHIGEKIVPHFYKMLMLQDEVGQQQAKDDLLNGLKAFDIAMREISTPKEQSDGAPWGYFLGNEFSLVDIALGPHYQRCLSVLAHYRDFFIPNTDEFARLRIWWEVVSKRPSFARTIVSKQRLLDNYIGYASGRGKSDASRKYLGNR